MVFSETIGIVKLNHNHNFVSLITTNNMELTHSKIFTLHPLKDFIGPLLELSSQHTERDNLYMQRADIAQLS